MSRCYCSLVPCSSNVQIPCLSHSVMILMIATMMLMIVTTIPPISTNKTNLPDFGTGIFPQLAADVGYSDAFDVSK